jgi:uncharacterized lipoprotein YddW (UPF0748 family)
MKQLLRLPFVATFLFALVSLDAQTQAPVAEMRGAWIATIANIDWPSKPGLTPDRQRIEFDSLLDVLKSMGFNAVFVQVRPAGDAFYNAPNVPWSKYLTGVQGLAPEPNYDPLEYMIKAAHSRRMEFHAWLNPYRATFDLDTASLASKHPMRALPKDRLKQWFFRYGKRYYFNPANPLVVSYLTNVVKDITLRYDVDGIHFDDYFYPYKEANESINDYNEFASDPRGFTNIEDWRRNNVNMLIEGCWKAIKGIKPYVRFGISPFGVWRNVEKDPVNGSDTRAGMTCYDDLYADVLLWLKNGWIDYVAPQLYWSIGFPPADYAKLVEWWSRRTNGRHLYIGHAAYKIGNSPNDANWNQHSQISRQIALNRSNPNVQGSIFFSSKPLMRNPLGVQDSIKYNLFSNQALIPPLATSAKSAPATPKICRVKGSPSSIKMAWNICDIGAGDEMPYYFAIYRFEGEYVGDFKDPRNLLMITPYNMEEWIYEDPTTYEGGYYTYVVTAFNRYNMESYSSDPVFIKKTKKGSKKKRKFWGYLLK